jgi:hypothetical protein
MNQLPRLRRSRRRSGLRAWRRTAVNSGHYERVTARGPSLAANLDGDSPDARYRSACRSCEQSAAAHPWCTCCTDSRFGTRWLGEEGGTSCMCQSGRCRHAAGVSEMMIVMPNAFAKFRAACTATRPRSATGRHLHHARTGGLRRLYRTLATPAGRGLAGHSWAATERCAWQ